jgi:hypothetical protein
MQGMKLIIMASLIGVAAGAHAAVYFNRATFLADPLAINLVNEDFEAYSLGTDLQGATIGNAVLQAPFTTTLIVQDTGVRFGGFPSSGTKLISPGGTVAAQENDDLTITFGTAVNAAGIDVCFDVADGASFTTVKFFDESGTQLFTTASVPCPFGAPGYTFVGATSATAIKTIVFDEFDASPQDDHIMYDSMVYSSVPEPSTIAAFAAAGLLAARRKRARRRS